MFESLTDRLQSVFRNLRGHGHLTETELRDGLREIRLALLEADVHLSVVRQLVERVRERATAEEILKSLSPGQQIVKLVRDELAEVLSQGRDTKIIVFHKKKRKRYQKKNGHRQPFTEVRIQSIVG